MSYTVRKFRYICRINAVHFQEARKHSPRLYHNEAIDLRLTVRAVSNTCWYAGNKTNVCKGNACNDSSGECVRFNDRCNEVSAWTESMENFEMNSGVERGTKRGDLPTCPLPSASTVKQGLVSLSVGSLGSVCTTAMLQGIEDSIETCTDSTIKSQRLLGVAGLSESTGSDTRDKFSPKVFSTISKSLVHSFEDLNTSMDYIRPLCQSCSEKSDNSRPWGSLQEIRNVGTFVQDTCLVRLGLFFFLPTIRNRRENKRYKKRTEESCVFERVQNYAYMHVHVKSCK